MSKKENNGYSRHCLVKTINGIKFFMFKSWDFTHGYGYFVHSANGYTMGFGFHKTSKIAAVRQSLKSLKRYV